VLFFSEFIFIYIIGYISLPSSIFQIYFNVLLVIYPFIFYVFEHTIFKEFDDHREFFKNFLNQLIRKD